MSIEEQSNPQINIRTPNQPVSSFTGDPFVDAKIKPSELKTYYVVIPRGAQYFNFETKEAAGKDAELWCAWRRIFGFKKLPLEFQVLYTFDVARGTRIVITYTDFTPGQTNTAINRFDFIPGGYPLLIADPQDPNLTQRIMRDRAIRGIYYSITDDEAFQTFFPELYKTC